jgi:hypothetical protein
MQTVNCPHCSAELAYDHSRAGQASACGVCGQLFQMPVLAAPVAEPADHEHFDLNRAPPDEPGPRKRPDRASHRRFFVVTVVALGILPLITLTFVIALIWSRYASMSRPNRPTHGATPRRK